MPTLCYATKVSSLIGQLRRFIGVKHEKLGQQLRLIFRVRRVLGNTFNGADNHALGFVEMTDAFSAFIRVNFIDFLAHVNGSVRTLRFANVTINTLVGDNQRHAISAVVCLNHGV